MGKSRPSIPASVTTGTWAIIDGLIVAAGKNPNIPSRTLGYFIFKRYTNVTSSGNPV